MIRVFHVIRLRLWPIVIRRAVLVSFIRLYLSIKVGFNLLILFVVISNFKLI